MDQISANLLDSLAPACMAVLISSAAMLYLRSADNHPRRILGHIMTAWALMMMPLMIFINTASPEQYMSPTLLSPYTLFTGYFSVLITYSYPLEIVLPGWLTRKRLMLAFIPMTTALALYWGIMAILGQTPEIITSYEQLTACSGNFNVWFRYIILGLMLSQLAVTITAIKVYRKKFENWRDENFSDNQNMDVKWIKLFNLLFLMISVSFVTTLFCTDLIAIVIHTALVLIFSFICLYNGLFQEIPYPRNFFEKTIVMEKAIALNDANEVRTDVKEDMEINEKAFPGRMQEYTAVFEEWMEKEKPYLSHDFKLTDVARIIPLNRSYISRLFNDGMHKSFSDVVREYRISYAKNLIRNNPDMNLSDISSMSGFTSSSTFIRSFTIQEGVTPKLYRKRLKGNA